MIWLRLKLIADAGLVGLPNAGKSTFLAAVTAAKPKIADYPFTTLHPGLGVARIDGREFVLADIPGLIEGAHEGVGIGDRFLGHVERTRVLLHLVSAQEESPGKAYKTVRAELEAYGNGLAEKPEIVALSQVDTLDAATAKKKAASLKRAAGRAPVHAVGRDGRRRRGGAARADRRVIGARGAPEAASERSTLAELGLAMSDPVAEEYRRITVKIGSALLVDRQTGLKREWLASLADDVASLASGGAEILVVSSGAIALGRTILGLGKRTLKLEESQAAAAVGQIALAGAWSEELGRKGLKSGQILLTLGDTEERRRYLNARATIGTLLKMKAVPVINENDTVATSEIRYGDNDRLAARVATMMGGDLLVLLSDIDGLYTAPPAFDPKAKFLPVVERITPEIEAMAGAAASELSRGGMRTKLDAGKIATTAGTAMIITSGARQNPLTAIERGERFTLFQPSRTPVKGYKTLDRRTARTGRPADRRRRRDRRAVAGQVAAAGGREARQRQFLARRHGGRAVARRFRDRARAGCL